MKGEKLYNYIKIALNELLDIKERDHIVFGSDKDRKSYLLS